MVRGRSIPLLGITLTVKYAIQAVKYPGLRGFLGGADDPTGHMSGRWPLVCLAAWT